MPFSLINHAVNGKGSSPTLTCIYAFRFRGIDFEGQVVGMAGIGTICGLSSTGVNMVRMTSMDEISIFLRNYPLTVVGDVFAKCNRMILSNIVKYLVLKREIFVQKCIPERYLVLFSIKRG